MGRRRDIDAAIAAIPNAYLGCREHGHAWTPFDAFRIPGGFDRRLRCRDCGAHRHQLLSRQGEILTNSYAYPDGYLVVGVGRLDGAERGLIRVAALGDVRQGGTDG